jgi:vitamin K-dependent gamma-carboxylase
MFLKNIFRPAYWFENIDISPLVIFRIVVGLVVIIDAFGGMATGWTHRAFIEPEITFPFMGFEFLRALAGPPAYVFYTIYGLAGFLILFGAYYRAGTVVAAFFWTVIYLAQKTHYNNHYYLYVLVLWAMALVPAHRYYSYDAKRNPSIKSEVTPRWAILIFIVQLLIVYTYASVAKWYPDWIAGEPLEIWFRMKKNYPLIGGLLQQHWFHLAVAWGGVFYDLLIIPMLLWKRTRWLGVVISFLFHLFNSVVFQVGTFPYLMLGSMVLFFPPEQVRQWFFKTKKSVTPTFPNSLNTKQRGLLTLFTVYFAIQIFLPLRHHLFKGNVLWNEEGHRYAWRMMLRVKHGTLTFRIVDKDTNKEFKVHPNEFLTQSQTWAVGMHPDMTWQFVQFLKEHYAEKGMPNISIYANSKIKINYRPYAAFIDPSVDLAKVEWKRFQHSEWILDEPMSE